MKPRIAFVVQRCGIDVNGGAESLALMVARAMTAVWDVHIITTCARDYVTWANHYPAGIETIDGVTVHRFPVDAPRRTRHFDELSARLAGRFDSAAVDEQTTWMREQGPYSPGLLTFLQASRDDFRAFYFFTYLYATTYFGLPLVEDKAVLVPFAHDEWPIKLNMWTTFFERPRQFIFSTPEERAFLRARFPRAPLEGEIVGVGIDVPGEPVAARFAERYGVSGPFALYLGRIDVAKNCDELLEYFAYYKAAYEPDDRDLGLVLVGREVMPIPSRPWLRHVGFVNEQTKYDALAASRVLIMPSHLESLSLVLLEAWTVGRPVLVNADSDVLVGQCRRAQAGLWYADREEFAVALRTIVNDRGPALGLRGQKFVHEHYTWSAVVASYERSLTWVTARSAPPGR